MPRAADFRFCPLCATALDRGVHGERERNACPACGWVHWDNPTPVVAALIQLEGKVLIARNAAWPEKMFGLITGFLERDESPFDAVAREVAEETALRVVSAELIGAYEFARMNQLIVAYHVVAEGAVRLSEELAEYRLIEPDRLRPWKLGTGLAMADWLRARGLPVNFIDLPAR
jgi:NADH pyrophosphatase NudC (nudix superfamily)